MKKLITILFYFAPFFLIGQDFYLEKKEDSCYTICYDKCESHIIYDNDNIFIDTVGKVYLNDTFFFQDFYFAQKINQAIVLFSWDKPFYQLKYSNNTFVKEIQGEKIMVSPDMFLIRAMDGGMTIFSQGNGMIFYVVDDNGIEVIYPQPEFDCKLNKFTKILCGFFYKNLWK